MNIAIFGLGYVGCVTAACLTDQGHSVIGVDVNQTKVEMINEGLSPIIEPGLGDLISRGVTSGNLRATNSAEQTVAQSNIILICVGTPSNGNGSLDLTYVCRAAEDIGKAIAQTVDYKLVVLRSTTLPGSVRGEILPLLESSPGKKLGRDFGFATNPEFLREGTAIQDFRNPPFTVIGQYDERSGQTLAKLYAGIDAPVYRVPLGVAEMVKYASNIFHGLKVTFANEIGNLCKAQGLDSHQVMDVFCQDTQLNLSPYYLKPGFAFGGSCLPKDLRAILYEARQHDLSLPVLESIQSSNAAQIDRGLDMVLATGKRKVGVLGLSFKPSTDDLRESPTVELVERLIGKGFDLRIFDQEVSLSQLHGSNLAFIDRAIPHIASLLVDTIEDVVTASQVILITKRPSRQALEQLNSILTPNHIVIDLVRIDKELPPHIAGDYRGICW